MGGGVVVGVLLGWNVTGQGRAGQGYCDSI